MEKVTFEEALKEFNKGYFIQVKCDGRTEGYQLGNYESKGFDREIVVNEFNNEIENTMHDLNWKFVLHGEWFVDKEREIIKDKPPFWER